jgi:Arf/Sar family protein
MGNIVAKLKELFSSKKLEVILIGLENSGKTTLVNQLHLGESSQTAPTIGLNVKNFKRGVI